MIKVLLKDAVYIKTGKLDSNASVENGIYNYFTCAPEPLKIDVYAFDEDVILIAGNNAQGNFHISRYKGKFNAYQRTYILTAKGGFDVDYLYYKLKLELKKLKEHSQGSQTKFLTKPIIENISFAEISYFSQQKIAAVLSALDDKIELNNQINAELEAMAKTLYDYWFVQFDFPLEFGPIDFAPGESNEKATVADRSRGYKSSGGKMVYNEVLKREIPEGWEVKNIFDVAKVQYGFPFSTQFFNADEVGVPVIRIRDILENSISNYSSEKNVDEKYVINKGDLLIGMDGNFHINYWSKNGCYLNQRVVMIKEKNIPNMVVRYQIEPYIKLREKSVSRTTVGHLSDKDLKRLNILVPTKAVAEKSKKLFDHFLQKIVTNQNQNQELAQLRDWLLPMLMNGQVTVGDVEERLGMVAEEKAKYQKS